MRALLLGEKQGPLIHGNPNAEKSNMLFLAKLEVPFMEVARSDNGGSDNNTGLLLRNINQTTIIREPHYFPCILMIVTDSTLN